MHKDTPSCIKALLNELDAFGKGLQQVLVVHIVNFYNLVGVAFEESLIQRQSQDGQHMRDSRGLQRFLAA